MKERHLGSFQMFIVLGDDLPGSSREFPFFFCHTRELKQWNFPVSIVACFLESLKGVFYLGK